MAFVVIHWTPMLSPLYSQALTRAVLTAASALSGDVPSLMMLLITGRVQPAHYPDGHLGPRASPTTSVGSPPSGDPGLSTRLLPSVTHRAQLVGKSYLPFSFLSPNTTKHILLETLVTQML